MNLSTLENSLVSATPEQSEQVLWHQDTSPYLASDFFCVRAHFTSVSVIPPAYLKGHKHKLTEMQVHPCERVYTAFLLSPQMKKLSWHTIL